MERIFWLEKHTPRGHLQQEGGRFHCQGTLIAIQALVQACTPD